MEWKSSSGISNIGVEFANAWDGLHFDLMNFVFISDLFPEHHRLLLLLSIFIEGLISRLIGACFCLCLYGVPLASPQGDSPRRKCRCASGNGRRLWGIVNTAISVAPLFSNTLFPLTFGVWALIHSEGHSKVCSQRVSGTSGACGRTPQIDRKSVV